VTTGDARWVGAVESYYGKPLRHEARLDLVRWLGSHGFNAYAYGPKDDPYHRTKWREPYPAAEAEHLRELIAFGEDCGVHVGMMLSPGLDWRDGDEDALAAKMRSLRELGTPLLSVAWDDIPGTGAELGEAHGRAITHAMAEVGDDTRWMAVPIDYATPVVTPYLQAFSDALPDGVDIAWTGPGIVSPHVTGADARRLAEELGRPLLFAENFPVNDGPMSGVLHLGPYPERDPALVDEVSGVFCNFMPNKPIASRIGLGCAAAWWNDPSSDREATWTTILKEFDGIEPLARACRSWVTTPSPDQELVEMANDGRLLAFLITGCRDGLDPALEAECEPWLDQWEWEGMAMQVALIAQMMGSPPGLQFITSTFWQVARRSLVNVFGIRNAMYPVTTITDGQLVTTDEALVTGENLTDQLCRRAISG
jgi:hypothetical protein